MDVDEMLRCLAEADSGQLRPELCDGRYAVVVFNPDGACLEEESQVVGEASSVYGALDELANAVICDHYESDLIQDVLAEREDAPALPGIQTEKRWLLAQFALGLLGPMDVVTEDHWSDPYLGQVSLLFTGARFVFLASAAPPNQDEAHTILELQPTGTPSPADRSLMAAGDAAAVEIALADGADANALDERGMSPLHHAVAHRRPDAVAALLAAGADPALQAEYGNAPHFAALGPGKTVSASVERVEHADHWRILRTLIEAGAPVNAGDRTGATLLDHAIATHPYPQEAIRFLADRGARAAHLESKPLNWRLERLPYDSITSLQRRVNEVRFLLDSGANTDGALHALLGDTGYYEHEVPGEILLALVEEILRHGARDTPDNSGRTALERAESWLANGKHPNYEPTVKRLRAFHSLT
jgi:hypothetical protein